MLILKTFELKRGSITHLLDRHKCQAHNDNKGAGDGDFLKTKHVVYILNK